jgi:hypothetical protein
VLPTASEADPCFDDATVPHSGHRTGSGRPRSEYPQRTHSPNLLRRRLTPHFRWYTYSTIGPEKRRPRSQKGMISIKPHGRQLPARPGSASLYDLSPIPRKENIKCLPTQGPEPKAGNTRSSGLVATRRSQTMSRGMGPARARANRSSLTIAVENSSSTPPRRTSTWNVLVSRTGGLSSPKRRNACVLAFQFQPSSAKDPRSKIAHSSAQYPSRYFLKASGATSKSTNPMGTQYQYQTIGTIFTIPEPSTPQSQQYNRLPPKGSAKR